MSTWSEDFPERAPSPASETPPADPDSDYSGSVIDALRTELAETQRLLIGRIAEVGGERDALRTENAALKAKCEALLAWQTGVCNLFYEHVLGAPRP